MIINNTQELQELTGSFFNSGTFSRIRTDIQLETEAIIRLIGQLVYAKAEAEYIPPSESEPVPEQTELVQHIQLPIAIMATLRYYQANMLSHGDNGRKVKINSEYEKMAWEWMIRDDDQAQLRKARHATDRLIRHLESNQYPEWIGSDSRKRVRSLFINTTELFEQIFPIDNSPMFFYTVVPFLRSIQNTQVKPAMGDDYPRLLEGWQNNELTPQDLQLVELIQQALPLLTMAMASRRLSVQVLPEAVVQRFHSESLKSSEPALEKVIRRFRDDLLEEGQELLDQAKQLRSNDETESIYIPENDQQNKYMRT